MDELENKNLDSFIWSSTYERYEKNILKDKEDKKLGQWNLDGDKIKNLKYAEGKNNLNFYIFFYHLLYGKN